MKTKLMKTAIIGFLKASMIGMLCFGYAFTAESPSGPQDENKQTQGAGQKSGGEQKDDSADKININTGDAEELKKLPRIGPKMAQRIIDFRTEHGEFKKLEELLNVKGIGPKTFATLKPLIKL
ncbi:MAG: helix-hairpin-helix domain-containing protein [Acidobacteriota bacterium]|nr:helix-hairpin-helix domain-containing protein [Acidobacteriota bacterium]